MFDFLTIGFADVLDILLVGLVIFYAFRLLKGSQAMSIFWAIVLLFALRIVCDALQMKMMSRLLGALLDVGLIALIIIFQPEIRRFLSSLGNSTRIENLRWDWLRNLLGRGGREMTGSSVSTINEICKACEQMSKEKCGALIVIKKKNQLKHIEDTGDIVDAIVSQRLLRNLFFKNSPLHDGAVIISNDRVSAARCTLPITQSETPPQYGMRHKAAVGISEESDAQVVVVSEETGGITVFRGGKGEKTENINDLKRLLQNG